MARPRRPGTPAWYHNLRAHPDRVTFEIGGRRVPARAEELTGAEREAAMRRIAASQPRFGGYERRTDRKLPVIRLSARG
ncbi:nitroreductase family deazaflavin-dependent oxidoreductase [Dactylosporangium sp. NPDC005572]|uniref:nitroreductase family deazaflavin-dependent oxidoreductase n=1 Tax=Dactylosporangium sp. NPDC005572 TaxID=3156889 RepID=UPI0033B73C06